jgi:hypothetical protein
MAPATPHDYDAQLAHLERLADLLDSRWRIPGLGIPIGIDGIASIFPVVGDSATGVVSAYLIYQASRLGVPRSVLLRMAGNAGLDWAVGSSPVLGTIFDIGFKANTRNVNLLRRHLERERDRNPALRPTLRRV